MNAVGGIQIHSLWSKRPTSYSWASPTISIGLYYLNPHENNIETTDLVVSNKKWDFGSKSLEHARKLDRNVTGANNRCSSATTEHEQETVRSSIEMTKYQTELMMLQMRQVQKKTAFSAQISTWNLSSTIMLTAEALPARKSHRCRCQIQHL